MADNFPKAGVELVALNAPGFQKALDQSNKALNNFMGATQNVAKQAGQSNKSVIDLIGSFKTLINPVTIATAAVAAMGKAFADLGARGAKVYDVADSFRRLAGDAGVLANVLLKDLRTAARGTVSDFDLMKQANIALAGTMGQFRTEFLENLPKLLEIARVQARATGQDVDFLYQSLITGVKRSSPLLIDNTGLVIKIGAANEAYAASLGKTVEQLTAEEKQMALLQATLDAGALAVEKLGTANLTASEKLAAIPVAIQNAVDRVAVAIQPLWDTILTGVLDVANGIGDFISNQVAPALNRLAQFISEIISVIGPGVQAIWNFVQPIFQAIINIIGGVVNFIAGEVSKFFKGGYYMVGALAGGMQRAYTELIQPVIIGIAEFIASFLSGQSPPPEGPLSDIDQGGANTMQAWLDGFIGVALDPVAEVAAQVQAMMGEIANYSLQQVQERFAQLDAQLKPFSDRVDILKSRFDALNEPAQQALDAIDRQMQKAEAALMQGDAAAAETLRRLDAQKAAIQNVIGVNQDVLDNAQIQLALARAQQEEERTLLNIRKAMLPVQEAAAAASEKTSKAKKKATGGAAPKEKKPTGTAESITTPGAGVTPLGGDIIAAQDLEGLIPPEEVPFGIGEDIANSVAEGWLAGIGGVEGAAKFTQGQEQLSAALSKIGGSSLVQNIFKGIGDIQTELDKNLIQPITNAIGSISYLFTGTGPGSLGFAFSNIKFQIEAALANIGPALTPLVNVVETAILDVGNFLFGEGEGTLRATVSSIGSKIGEWLADAPSFFAKLGEGVFGDEGVVPKIVQWLTDPAYEGGLANVLSNLSGDILFRLKNASEWFSELGDAVFGPEGIIPKIVGWFTDPTQEGGLAQTLGTLGPTIRDWFTTASVDLSENPLVKALLGSFQSVINFLVGTEMTEEGGHTLYTAIIALGEQIGGWLEPIIGTINDMFVQPIIGEEGILRPIIDYFFNPDEEGTLAYALNTLFNGDEGTLGSIPYYIKQATDFLLKVPGKVIDALKELGMALWNGIAVPFINVINFVIDKVNDFVKTISEAILGAYNSIASAVGQPTIQFGAIPEIPKISTTPPGWLTGAAAGGLFSGGILRVGERGEELIASANKMAVFPNKMVNAMDNLASVMAQPVPMPVTGGYGGGDTIDNSRSLTIHGGMGGDATDERRLLAHLMAFFEGF